MLDAVDLGQTGRTCQSAGDQKGDHEDPVRADPAETGGIRIVSDSPDTEPQRRFVKQNITADSGQDRQHKSEVYSRSVYDLRQVSAFCDRICLQVFRFGLFQYCPKQIIHKCIDYISGHHRDQKFIGVKPCLGQPDQSSDQCACGKRTDPDDDQQQRCRDLVSECQGKRNCRDRSGIKLTLCTDVI